MLFASHTSPRIRIQHLRENNNATAYEAISEFIRYTYGIHFEINEFSTSKCYHNLALIHCAFYDGFLAGRFPFIDTFICPNMTYAVGIYLEANWDIKFRDFSQLSLNNKFNYQLNPILNSYIVFLYNCILCTIYKDSNMFVGPVIPGKFGYIMERSNDA